MTTRLLALARTFAHSRQFIHYNFLGHNCSMSLKLSSVLITDEVDPKCIAILQQNGVEVVKNTKLAKDKQALLAEIPVGFFGL